MFFKFLSFKIFFISLAVGLLFAYLSSPEPTIIYVYPTPDNVAKVEYKDKADNCFNFDAKEEKCPFNPGTLKTIPIQV